MRDIVLRRKKRVSKKVGFQFTDLKPYVSRLSLIALVISIVAPLSASAGLPPPPPPPDPSGTVVITKYDCPEGLIFDNSLTSPAKPDTSGAATVPAECSPAAGYHFGYIYEPSKTDVTSPYPGVDDATPFTPIPGTTNGSGQITITSLPNGGRVDLVELDASDMRVDDSQVYGFMCMDDEGTKSDNYDIIFNATSKTSYCNVYNIVKERPVTILADKVVCLTEADLPNWGGAGIPTQPEPGMIDGSTAADYVAGSAGRCHLESDWSFQYGFAEHDNTGGVNKLPGAHIGQADGTSTLGDCNPTYCGNSTFTGTNYNDWKNFDTATSGGGAISAAVTVADLEEAPGIWVRENLKAGYVPFTYPPVGAPGSSVSAEIYCHDDIQNFDNYDEITGVVLGETYHCVAFNAPKTTTIKAYKVVCLNEADLPNWGLVDSAGKPSIITATTASDFVAASDQQCELQEGWSFQYGFAEKDSTSGVNKLPGAHIGAADGTSTLGDCNPTYCGNNTFTGTGYADWKTFDTSTSSGGAVAAEVNVNDLEGAPGIWVRENLKDGYVPFTYPPDGPPGSDVSAEIYCHTDIINYDNYDEIINPEPNNTYYCVAFNALKDKEIDPNPTPPPPPPCDCIEFDGSISGTKFGDLNADSQMGPGEVGLAGWTIYLDLNDNGSKDTGEPSAITGADGKYSITGIADGTYVVREEFQLNWLQTFPGVGASYKQSGIVSGGLDTPFIDFGNKFIGNVQCITDCLTANFISTSSSGGGNGGGGPTPSPSPTPTPTPSPLIVDEGAGGTGEDPGQVLGASTELPRTGVSILTWTVFLLSLASVPFLMMIKEKKSRRRTIKVRKIRSLVF